MVSAHLMLDITIVDVVTDIIDIWFAVGYQVVVSTVFLT